MHAIVLRSWNLILPIFKSCIFSANSCKMISIEFLVNIGSRLQSLIHTLFSSSPSLASAVKAFLKINSKLMVIAACNPKTFQLFNMKEKSLQFCDSPQTPSHQTLNILIPFFNRQGLFSFLNHKNQFELLFYCAWLRPALPTLPYCQMSHFLKASLTFFQPYLSSWIHSNLLPSFPLPC